MEERERDEKEREQKVYAYKDEADKTIIHSKQKKRWTWKEAHNMCPFYTNKERCYR